MANLFHINGIVISRRDHREADRWYSAYTREMGKIEFLARGAHKPLAKLSPHLESLGEVELLLVDGRQYFTVAGVERREAFPSASLDYARLMLATSALHLVDIGTKPHEADPILYEQIVAWLRFLEESPSLRPERAAFLLGAFTLKLMALIGYRPELARCLACTESLLPGAYRWHALKGGVVCTPCVARDPAQWFAARTLHDDTLKLMRFALSEPFASGLRPLLPGPALEGFHDAIESLIVSHFPTIPASSLRAACLV